LNIRGEPGGEPSAFGGGKGKNQETHHNVCEDAVLTYDTEQDKSKKSIRQITWT